MTVAGESIPTSPGWGAHRRDRVAGLALVCPLLIGVRDVPEHRAVVAEDDLGDEEFRGYFVVQTPAMLDRYPRAALAVLDGAGHALPHEKLRVLADLIDDWLARSALTASTRS